MIRRNGPVPRWYRAILLISILLLGSTSSLAQDYSKRGLRTYLDVSIEMEKKVYTLGDLLEGKVVIYNRAPATLFGGFDVKLYKGDDLRYATTVYVKTLFPGETEFRFKNFGVPKLREDESSLGDWRLVVHQSNRPENAAQAEFRINGTQGQEGTFLQNRCYTIDATSALLADVIRKIFHELERSALLRKDYPQYGKTEIVGEYWGPHTIISKPISASGPADSILVDEGKFITFKVWGLNARAPRFSDFVYLLQETDPEAVTSRMRGVKKYRYIEIDYQYLFPTNEAGRIDGDFSSTVDVVTAMRRGLADAGAKACP